VTLLGDRRRLTIRVASSVIGLALVWLTVLAFTHASPPDLTVALLVVLAEVLAVAVLSGPVLAVAVALAAVVLVNWYLVPPYGTFAIASTDNVVALVVFAFVAAVAAALVEVGARARSSAAESSRQAELLGDIVVVNKGDDTATALERIREALGLDRVELMGPLAGEPAPVLLAYAGSESGADAVIDVPLSDHYRMLGRGTAIFAPDPDFLTSLGSAAVLAFESERLEVESHRAEELAAIDRARTALLASVGHDLRTPLAGLRVSVDTLRATDAPLSAEDRAELMDTISVSVDRLDELITNLLDMSRLQAGAVLAHPQATDVPDVIDRVLIAAPDARVRVLLPAFLPAVSADPALLERMLANLVSNALRYSPRDTPVTVLARISQDRVRLEVRDRGPGIPPAERDQVFRPFHRVGAQADGGSGLGLAIVRGFGDAMGIAVELLPGEDGGLCACLTMQPWPGRGVLS
jgi:two-component system sensor histidine kinase KdpD